MIGQTPKNTFKPWVSLPLSVGKQLFYFIYLFFTSIIYGFRHFIVDQIVF